MADARGQNKNSYFQVQLVPSGTDLLQQLSPQDAEILKQRLAQSYLRAPKLSAATGASGSIGAGSSDLLGGTATSGGAGARAGTSRMMGGGPLPGGLAAGTASSLQTISGDHMRALMSSGATSSGGPLNAEHEERSQESLLLFQMQRRLQEDIKIIDGERKELESEKQQWRLELSSTTLGQHTDNLSVIKKLRNENTLLREKVGASLSVLGKFQSEFMDFATEKLLAKEYGDFESEAKVRTLYETLSKMMEALSGMSEKVPITEITAEELKQAEYLDMKQKQEQLHQQVVHGEKGLHGENSGKQGGKKGGKENNGGAQVTSEKQDLHSKVRKKMEDDSHLTGVELPKLQSLEKTAGNKKKAGASGAAPKKKAGATGGAAAGGKKTKADSAPAGADGSGNNNSAEQGAAGEMLNSANDSGEQQQNEDANGQNGAGTTSAAQRKLSLLQTFRKKASTAGKLALAVQGMQKTDKQKEELEKELREQAALKMTTTGNQAGGLLAEEPAKPQMPQKVNFRFAPLLLSFQQQSKLNRSKQKAGGGLFTVDGADTTVLDIAQTEQEIALLKEQTCTFPHLLKALTTPENNATSHASSNLTGATAIAQLLQQQQNMQLHSNKQTFSEESAKMLAYVQELPELKQPLQEFTETLLKELNEVNDYYLQLRAFSVNAEKYYKWRAMFQVLLYEKKRRNAQNEQEKLKEKLRKNTEEVTRNLQAELGEAKEKLHYLDQYCGWLLKTKNEAEQLAVVSQQQNAVPSSTGVSASNGQMNKQTSAASTTSEKSTFLYNPEDRVSKLVGNNYNTGTGTSSSNTTLGTAVVAAGVMTNAISDTTPVQQQELDVIEKISLVDFIQSLHTGKKDNNTQQGTLANKFGLSVPAKLDYPSIHNAFIPANYLQNEDGSLKNGKENIKENQQKDIVMVTNGQDGQCYHLPAFKTSIQWEYELSMEKQRCKKLEQIVTTIELQMDQFVNLLKKNCVNVCDLLYRERQEVVRRLERKWPIKYHELATAEDLLAVLLGTSDFSGTSTSAAVGGSSPSVAAIQAGPATMDVKSNNRVVQQAQQQQLQKMAPSRLFGEESQQYASQTVNMNFVPLQPVEEEGSEPLVLAGKAGNAIKAGSTTSAPAPGSLRAANAAAAAGTTTTNVSAQKEQMQLSEHELQIQQILLENNLPQDGARTASSQALAINQQTPPKPYPEPIRSKENYLQNNAQLAATGALKAKQGKLPASGFLQQGGAGGGVTATSPRSSPGAAAAAAAAVSSEVLTTNVAPAVPPSSTTDAAFEIEQPTKEQVQQIEYLRKLEFSQMKDHTQMLHAQHNQNANLLQPMNLHRALANIQSKELFGIADSALSIPTAEELEQMQKIRDLHPTPLLAGTIVSASSEKDTTTTAKDAASATLRQSVTETIPKEEDKTESEDSHYGELTVAERNRKQQLKSVRKSAAMAAQEGESVAGILGRRSSRGSVVAGKISNVVSSGNGPADGLYPLSQQTIAPDEDDKNADDDADQKQFQIFNVDEAIDKEKHKRLSKQVVDITKEEDAADVEAPDSLAPGAGGAKGVKINLAGEEATEEISFPSSSAPAVGTTSSLVLPSNAISSSSAREEHDNYSAALTETEKQARKTFMQDVYMTVAHSDFLSLDDDEDENADDNGDITKSQHNATIAAVSNTIRESLVKEINSEARKSSKEVLNRSEGAISSSGVRISYGAAQQLLDLKESKIGEENALSGLSSSLQNDLQLSDVSSKKMAEAEEKIYDKDKKRVSSGVGHSMNKMNLESDGNRTVLAGGGQDDDNAAANNAVLTDAASSNASKRSSVKFNMEHIQDEMEYVQEADLDLKDQLAVASSISAAKNNNPRDSVGAEDATRKSTKNIYTLTNVAMTGAARLGKIREWMNQRAHSVAESARELSPRVIEAVSDESKKIYDAVTDLAGSAGAAVSAAAGSSSTDQKTDGKDAGEFADMLDYNTDEAAASSADPETAAQQKQRGPSKRDILLAKQLSQVIESREKEEQNRGPSVTDVKIAEDLQKQIADQQEEQEKRGPHDEDVEIAKLLKLQIEEKEEEEKRVLEEKHRGPSVQDQELAQKFAEQIAARDSAAERLPGESTLNTTSADLAAKSLSVKKSPALEKFKKNVNIVTKSLKTVKQAAQLLDKSKLPDMGEVSVLRATKLVSTTPSKFQALNTFVKVIFGTEEKHTHVIPNTANPDWKMTLMFPHPGASEVVFEVWESPLYFSKDNEGTAAPENADENKKSSPLELMRDSFVQEKLIGSCKLKVRKDSSGAFLKRAKQVVLKVVNEESGGEMGEIVVEWERHKEVSEDMLDALHDNVHLKNAENGIQTHGKKPRTSQTTAADGEKDKATAEQPTVPPTQQPEVVDHHHNLFQNWVRFLAVLPLESDDADEKKRDAIFKKLATKNSEVKPNGDLSDRDDNYHSGSEDEDDLILKREDVVKLPQIMNFRLELPLGNETLFAAFDHAAEEFGFNESGNDEDDIDELRYDGFYALLFYLYDASQLFYEIKVRNVHEQNVKTNTENSAMDTSTSDDDFILIPDAFDDKIDMNLFKKLLATFRNWGLPTDDEHAEIFFADLHPVGVDLAHQTVTLSEAIKWALEQGDDCQVSRKSAVTGNDGKQHPIFQRAKKRHRGRRGGKRARNRRKNQQGKWVKVTDEQGKAVVG
ncbi:unnamed protein product [Amoebophrya sp. A120]|nr:unnamed protein product [Amoebophrya sp. A120]|eukprot:GSA120T00009858001.1